MKIFNLNTSEIRPPKLDHPCVCWNGVLFACAEFTTHPTLNYASSECGAHTRAYPSQLLFDFFLFFRGAEERREMACLIGGGLRELPTNYMERQHAISRATIQMMNYMCKGTNGNTQRAKRERHTHTHPKLCFIMGRWERERTRMVGGDGGGGRRPTFGVAKFWPSSNSFPLWQSPSSIDRYVHTIQSSRLYKRPSMVYRSLSEPTTQGGASL